MARSEAGELLADVVAPIRYAVRGGALATDLRRYKSEHGDAAEAALAAGRLGELLAGFLAEHGAAVWRAAGMPAGPSAVAVVPTGQGRVGPHPLLGLVRGCLGLPLVRESLGLPLAWQSEEMALARQSDELLLGRQSVEVSLARESDEVLLARQSRELPFVGLSVRPGEIHRRGVNPRWVRVDTRVAGDDILVVDDTWVSGGSAQSTAAALKRSGARSVAIVVLGRHVNPDDPRSAALLRAAAKAGKDFSAWCPPAVGSFVMRAGQ